MFKNIILLALSLLACFSLDAQIPREIRIDAPLAPAQRGTSARSSMMCNEAGTLDFGVFTGDSNDANSLSDDPSYLCFGDQFTIGAAQGIDVSGDPDPSTPAGIGYAFYRGEPTIDGPTLADILLDPNIITSPTNPGSPFIFADQLDGSATFQNRALPDGTTLQDLFNNGEPARLWFAPITFDALDPSLEAIFEGTPAGMCVDINIEEAFSVVYLNPVETQISATQCGGTITVTGGFAEFSVSRYDITVEHATKPDVNGTVTGIPRHGEQMTFSVPEAGAYNITAIDTKDCSSSTSSVDISCPASMDFTVSSSCPNTDVFVGEQFCLDVEVSNFNSLQAIQFRTDWDTSIIRYVSINVDQETITAISGLSAANFGTSNATQTGQVTLSWTTTDFDNGISFPDNTTLFTICFTAQAAGNPNFQIIDSPGDFSPIEIIDINNNLVNLTEEICPSLEIVEPLPSGEIQVRTKITKPCQGDTNGKVELSMAGGTLPYQLDLVGEVTGALPPIAIYSRDTILEGLAADSYNYTIVDRDREASKTSIFDGPIEIKEVDLIVIFDAEQPKCFGESSGRLEAIPLENTLPIQDLTGFQYAWDTGDTTRSAEDLAPGFYSLTITNPNGCTAENGDPLGNPELLEIIEMIPSDATCSGTFDGSMRAIADGGTGQYFYKWDIDTTRDFNILTDLDVGKYQVTVSDENGCTTVGLDSVSADIELYIDVAFKNDVQCFGQDNGDIQILSRARTTGTSVPPNYDFTWSPNAPEPFIENGTSTGINRLSPGIYSVTMTNTSIPPGCFASETFEIIEPEPLTLSVDITNVTKCMLPVPDGSATAMAAGGNGSYAYIWENIGSGTAIDNEATNLDADSIRVTVSDDKACITSLDTIIGNPPSPIINQFEDASITCASDTDGFLQVIAAQGAARISNYQWSHDPTITIGIAPQLGPDTYYVTITDENACSTIDSALVTAPPAIVFSMAEVVTLPCFGDANGSFEIAISGGSPGYQFDWELTSRIDSSFNDDVNLLSNAPAGNYIISGSDANDCRFDTTVTLPSLQEIVIEITEIQPTSCFDNGLAQGDGQATLTAVYADSTAGDFNFFWPNNEETMGASESTADSLGSGLNEVLIFETFGTCSTKRIVDVPSPPKLEVDNSAIDTAIMEVTCFGKSDGAVTINVIGGTPAYSFEWNTGATTANLSDLAAGNYTATITDMNDCPLIYDVAITQPDSLSVLTDMDETTTRITCVGDEDGRIQVAAMGGNVSLGPIIFNWAENIADGPIATGLSAGNYQVTVTDINGCTGSVEHSITEPPAISFSVGPREPILCNGLPATIVADPLSFSGGNGGDYTYSVDFSPDQTLDKVIQVPAGDHIITVYDAAGCEYDSIIVVPEPEPITIEFPDAMRDGSSLIAEVELGGSIALNPSIFSPTPIAENGIIWASSGSADTTFFCPDPTFCDNPSVSPLDNTTYTVMVTDLNGCTAQESILIEVDKNRNVYIPNAFAPNSRGFDLNENFKIYTGVGVRQVNFARVFNRWGTLVAGLETVLPNPSGISVWNGKLKGQKVPQGVYIYIVSVTFEDNVTLLYRGDITLIR